MYQVHFSERNDVLSKQTDTSSSSRGLPCGTLSGHSVIGTIEMTAMSWAKPISR